jgi:hypothetical protein
LWISLATFVIFGSRDGDKNHPETKGVQDSRETAIGRVSGLGKHPIKRLSGNPGSFGNSRHLTGLGNVS